MLLKKGYFWFLIMSLLHYAVNDYNRYCNFILFYLINVYNWCQQKIMKIVEKNQKLIPRIMVFLEPIVLKINIFSKKKFNFFVNVLICIFKKCQSIID